MTRRAVAVALVVAAVTACGGPAPPDTPPGPVVPSTKAERPPTSAAGSTTATGPPPAVDPSGPAATTRAPDPTTTPPTPAPPVTAPPVTAPPVTAPPATAPPATTSRWWRPPPRVTWHWQLTGTVDPAVDAEVFDVDLFDVPAEVVAELRRRGRRVLCYVSVGTFEPWRPDAGRFPPEVLGAPLDGWPDERWLDVRRLDLLGPVLTARLDRCRAKGFDGVEPDNVDAYANASGFPLTAADQLRFNRWVAEQAHARGLAVALKNDVEQAAELEPWFDLAVNEECVTYGECAALRPFVAAGKPVLHVEYDLPTARFCPATTALGFSSMRKRVALDAWFERCP